jgi:cellulose biosynthesis protein BcsQ
LQNLILTIYRQVRHIKEVEIRQLPTPFDNQSNMDLRVDFLMKKINEDELKNKLQRREKERNKKLEYREVLDMYVNVMQDLFYELQNTEDYVKFLKEEEKVRSYVESGIDLINSKYDSKLRKILLMF